MQISVIRAILTDTLHYLTNNGAPQLTRLDGVSIRQPICTETIAGLILGKPVESCIMGAMISTLYLGLVNAGGTLPTGPGIGGVMGTVLALSASATSQVAMSTAVPLGVMGMMIWTLRQTIGIYFVHQTDKYVVTGDIKKTAFWQLVLTQLFGYAVTMIPCALLAYFDASAIQGLPDMLVGKPLHILSTIDGIPLTIGIAMIIHILSTGNEILIFFILGFFLETYSRLSMLVVSIFAAIAAYFHGELKFGKTGNEE